MDADAGESAFRGDVPYYGHIVGVRGEAFREQGGRHRHILLHLFPSGEPAVAAVYTGSG